MNPINKLIAWWNGLSLQQKIIYLAILIIAAIIIRRNWYYIGRLFTGAGIDYEPGETRQIPDDRKNYLEDMAMAVKNDIYWTPWSGHDYGIYEDVLGVTDNELSYLAKFYKINLTNGKSMYSDIDGEWYMWSDVGDRVMTRLSKIGQI